MTEDEKFWLYGPPTSYHVGPYDPKEETWEEYLERHQWLVEKLDAALKSLENLSHEERLKLVEQSMVNAYGPDWDKHDD